MRETGGASSIAGSLSAGSVSSPDRASSSRRSISAVSKPVRVTSKPSVRSVRNRNEGEVLDFLVQSKRNAQAALKLMRKLPKKQGWTPTRITTDKLRSYHVAIRTLGLTAQHIDNKRANNRAENSGASSGNCC